MIKSFKCKKTAQLFKGERVPAFSGFARQADGFARQADKRLRILDAAETLEALKALPSNRFESLSGDRAGQYSIRVNMQWRVCFTWEGGAHEVEIMDYH
jgi:proteic killer suppression protein